MKTLTLYAKLDMLSSELKKEVEKFVEELLEKKMSNQKVPATTPISKRTFGSLKGKIHLSDDFDAPLEDFKEYM